MLTNKLRLYYKITSTQNIKKQKVKLTQNKPVSKFKANMRQFKI